LVARPRRHPGQDRLPVPGTDQAPGARPGLRHAAIGVYDRIAWNFICYITGYRKKMAPRVRQLIADHAGDAQVIVLRSRRAARRYLAGVAAPESAAVQAVAASEECG